LSDSPEILRTRTITWEDPMPVAAAVQTMSGLDALRVILDGKLPPPPIAQLLDFRLTEVSEGRAVFTALPAEYHYNPIGVVQGGLVATLLDSAMGCAVQSTLPAGTGYTTLEIKVNFVRPLTHDTGVVTCEGTVIYVGGRMATAEARLTDAAGKLYAHGTTICLIMRQ
jgi:uncharacterized protein (TIGR00369 family)